MGGMWEAVGQRPASQRGGVPTCLMSQPGVARGDGGDIAPPLAMTWSPLGFFLGCLALPRQHQAANIPFRAMLGPVAAATLCHPVPPLPAPQPHKVPVGWLKAAQLLGRIRHHLAAGPGLIFSRSARLRPAVMKPH